MSEIGDGKDFYDEGYEDDDRSINNRITFSREKLYGREDTLAILHGLFTRLCEQRNLPTSEETLAAAESPVVILSGYSGAGKSSLVERFIAELDQRKQEGSSKSFLCLSSKFEELQTPDPLSVIAQAFEGLCQSLLQEDQKAVLDRLRVSIEASLGEEANALASIIPDMKQVLGKTEASPLSSSSPSEGGGWNRLQYLFQKLIKALCHDDCPLIMFLDDLQWADSASISLLGALLKDSSLKNFMFIGAVRIEEMDKDHPVSKILSESEQITGKKIERIDLLNLSIHHVEHFIADTLNLEIEECEPLTEFVYGKTRGNVFYAMQVLEELERHKFLYYSMISFQWEWNMEGVDINAGLSENLDDTVASKIQHAPEKMQRALIIASYTRSSFHVQMLHVLMVADGYELPTSELVRLLDMAVLNGFLVNVVGSSTYRFAHDRIQQVAYSMVNGSSRDDLRRMIGTRLFKLVENDEGEDWMMFVAADHLNPCSIHDGGDSLTLARLNLLCGEKANVVAAYVPASIYLQLAIKNLRKCPDHWESNYYLSLRIFRALCDVELCLGNFESGDQLAKEVMDRAQNLQDRLPTFLSLAVAKGRQEQHAAGYQICLQALYDLNAVSRRYHALHVLKDLHIIKRKLKKYSDYDILLLPQLTNERKRSIARFLAEGQLRAYYCGEKNGILAPQQRADLDFALHLLSSMQRNCLQRCPGSRNLTFVVLFVSAMTGDMMGYMFCCLKGLRITLKYGLSAASAYAFAAYGLVLDRVNDHAGAMRMAALAKQVLSRVENTVESKVHKALTLVVISFYIEAWSCPREQILSTGHLAHEAGMESGNVDIGFLSWIISNNFAYATGYPLSVVEKTGREILQQLRLYNAESILSIFIQMRLPITTLLGGDKEDIDWEELAKFDTTSGDKKSETYRSSFGYLGRMELALYYGKFDLALACSTNLKPYMAHEASYTIVVKNLFYTGLAHSGLARKGGPMAVRYRSKASALSQEMETMCRTRGLTPLHKSLIMKADLFACRCKDMLKVASAYDAGISAAVKAGYMQDAALASELAGEFFLSMSNLAMGGVYISQACEIYREWGAMAKVKDIYLRRSTFLDSSIQEKAVTSSGHHPTWISAELSGSQNVDLDLLSGPIPRTELPDMSIVATARLSAQDRDEISILTDPSIERGSQNFNSNRDRE